MHKIHALIFSATTALAAQSFLVSRQLVQVPCPDLGRKDCGTGCIDLGWTCCPDAAGGCPPTASCSLGDNGEYGCCPNGQTCQGNGGVSSDINTRTLIIPGGEETSTAEPEPEPTATETDKLEPTEPIQPTEPPEPTESPEEPVTTPVTPPKPVPTKNATEPEVPKPSNVDVNGARGGVSFISAVGALAAAVLVL